MSTGAQYVVAAYAVVLFALLLYVFVLGLRTARIAREAELLSRLVEPEGAEARPEPALEPERAGLCSRSGSPTRPRPSSRGRRPRCRPPGRERSCAA